MSTEKKKYKLALTKKEKGYIENVIKEKDMMKAYNKAYNAGKTMTAYHRLVEVNEIMDKARVVEALQNELEMNDVDKGIIKLKVIAGLNEIADGKGNPPAVRLRAFELLGRLSGVNSFEQALEKPSNSGLSSAELEEKLQAMLERHLSKAKVIEP